MQEIAAKGGVRKAKGPQRRMSVGIHWLRGQRKHLALGGEEDFFFQECTPLFDVDGCLRQPLAESYLVVDVVTGPGDLGWPASQERQLSAGLSLETLIWVGPKEPQRDTGSLQFHL